MTNNKTQLSVCVCVLPSLTTHTRQVSVITGLQTDADVNAGYERRDRADKREPLRPGPCFSHAFAQTGG